MCSGNIHEICGAGWANSVYYASCSANPDTYLTNYWPICVGTMNDVIGAANMQQGSGTTSFVADRFGNPNSALALNGGWTSVPPGIYFNSVQFTITVWVYPLSVGSSARVIDFGNGAAGDNILLSLDAGGNLIPYFGIYVGGNMLSQPASTQALALNQWQFLAASFDGSMLKIYINGAITTSATVSYTSLTALTRANNFIGKSNWANGYSSSYLDDLRFYRTSLSQTQLLNLMSKNDTSSTYLSCLDTTTSTSTSTSTSKISIKCFKLFLFINC